MEDPQRNGDRVGYQGPKRKAERILTVVHTSGMRLQVGNDAKPVYMPVPRIAIRQEWRSALWTGNQIPGSVRGQDSRKPDLVGTFASTNTALRRYACPLSEWLRVGGGPYRVYNSPAGSAWRTHSCVCGMGPGLRECGFVPLPASGAYRDSAVFK